MSRLLAKCTHTGCAPRVQSGYPPRALVRVPGLRAATDGRELWVGVPRLGACASCFCVQLPLCARPIAFSLRLLLFILFFQSSRLALMNDTTRWRPCLALDLPMLVRVSMLVCQVLSQLPDFGREQAKRRRVMSCRGWERSNELRLAEIAAAALRMN
eukprot:1431243-Pleurochrysis_carterae.AAC.1